MKTDYLRPSAKRLLEQLRNGPVCGARMYGHKNQRIKELRDAGYNIEKAYACREESHRHIGTNWVYRLNEDRHRG
jgi:hypothetical protein